MQYNPTVAALIRQVNQDTLYSYVAQLSGVQPVTIGGISYTLETRNTDSGTPVSMASQFAYEYLLGLPNLDAVSYEDWSKSGSSGRNVIGQLTGSTRPDEIILLTAHIDDMPYGDAAPGADDNASGTAALLMAANLISQHTFERTIRFIFFTGEEQDMLGSKVYASSAHAAGENIVAVVNMDMLGWEHDGKPIMRLHTRPPFNQGAKDLEIAHLYVDVVKTYHIGLTPVITSYGMDESDHGSFWYQGYPAICVIEDDGELDSWGDFNPYYHTSSDTISNLNMPYFTNIVEASIGAAAHLAFPDSPPTIETPAPPLNLPALFQKPAQPIVNLFNPPLWYFNALSRKTLTAAFFLSRRDAAQSLL